MSKPYKLPRIRLTEAALIAAIPPFSYLLLWLYYQPQFEFYNVPIGLFRPNSMQALLFATILTVFFVLAYVLAQIISRAVPEHGPLWLRFKRFVGIFLVPQLLFVTIAIVRPGYLPRMQYFLLVQAWLSPITLYLLLSDFVLPLIRHRGKKNKFGQKAGLEIYRTPSSYLAYKMRLVLPMLVVLVCFVAYTMGTRATRGRRSYTIINSQPQQIVLINYGDKMLTAELEQHPDKNPRYIYRRNFKILDVNDLNKDSFTYLYIDGNQLKREEPR